MTTFNTGNPIGSTDARDRLDNSENLDLAVNSLSQTFVDRLGRTRDTLEGIYQKSAYYRAGTFDAGYTLTNNRQTLEYGGHEYSWAGTFPKVVAAGATPATSGGIGAGAWVDRTDVTLRSELAAAGGAGLIGTTRGDTVENELSKAMSVLLPSGDVDAKNVSNSSGRNVADNYMQIERMKKAIAALDNSGAVIILGDSISNGQGASTYKNSFIYKFCRSIFNRMNGVNSVDKGYGFETVMNMATAIKAPGVSHTGSVITSSGVVNSRLLLSNGQSLKITGREVRSVDIFYDASLSTGGLVFALNGSTYATKALSGSGTQTTFPTNPFTLDSSIHPDDEVTITASGGSVVVTGLITIRESQNSPYVYVAARSGWGFDEFADASRADEIASQVSAFRISAQKTLFVFLGTNNMYNPALQKSPGDYVAALSTMLGSYTARLSKLSIVLSVPLKANKTAFPLLSGYTYQDYANAIIEFADANGYSVIRFDNIGVDDGFYADGIHPDDAGHSALCAQACTQLGIPNNSGEFCDAITCEPYREQNLVYSGTWRNFLGLSSMQVKAQKIGRIVHLSGLADCNGTASLEIGTLPIGVRPRTNDAYLCCITSTGPAQLKIGTNGKVTVLSAPTGANSFVSLCGLSYLIK